MLLKQIFTDVMKSYMFPFRTSSQLQDSRQRWFKEDSFEYISRLVHICTLQPFNKCEYITGEIIIYSCEPTLFLYIYCIKVYLVDFNLTYFG